MEDGVQISGNVRTKAVTSARTSRNPSRCKRVFYVTGIASREIVETDNFIAFIQEALAEVRSEKPSPSSHSSAPTFHAFPLPHTTSCKVSPGQPDLASSTITRLQLGLAPGLRSAHGALN